MSKKLLLTLGCLLLAAAHVIAEPVQVQLTIWENNQENRETAVAHLDEKIEPGETKSVRFGNRKCEVTPILVDGEWIKVKLAMSELKEGKWGHTLAPSLMTKFNTTSKVTLNKTSYEVQVYPVTAD